MKIICGKKVIDLSKYDAVEYRESLLGSSEGYPVEATRQEAGQGIHLNLNMRKTSKIL